MNTHTESFAEKSDAETPTEGLPEAQVNVEKLPEHAGFMQLVDALLKSHESVFLHIKTDALARNALQLVALAGACLFVYGLIMGAFSGGDQWLAAPIKVMLGTALATLLCYPSLYILAALGGADLSPGQAAALLISTVALSTILLIGFAPVAFVFTFSIQALPFMGLIHLLIWIVSLHFGLRYFKQGLMALGGKDPTTIKVWILIFLLTLMQMSTTLRPILGSSEQWLVPEKQFFITHWLEALSIRH